MILNWLLLVMFKIKKGNQIKIIRKNDIRSIVINIFLHIKVSGKKFVFSLFWTFTQKKNAIKSRFINTKI